MHGRTDHQIAMAMLERVEGGAVHLPGMLDELVEALARKADLIRSEGRPHPGAPEALEALAERDDVVQSILTGNVEANAAVKLAAFGLERLVDLEVGGYGSDPHERRSDLVAVARERAEAKYGKSVPATRTTLVGDTPLDIEAAREAGARAVAVATGPHGTEDLRRVRPDAVLEDLRDVDALVAAVGA